MNENIREFKGNCIYTFLNNYTVIDIETTGLNPKCDEIIEIAAIKIRENKIVGQYNVLVKSNEKIPENIEQLTGITNQMVIEKGINIEDALLSFSNFICNDILIGHNINFDINFLYDNYLKYLKRPLINDFVDTLKISKNLINDTHDWKLSTLAKKYNIENVNAHRALNDVIVTNKIYEKLSSINENILDIRTNQLLSTLKEDDSLKNKKISFKSKLKYVEEPVIEHILKKLGSKSYFFLSKYAEILVVNDHEYEKLQIPLDENDPYILAFNEWKIKAQSRIKEGTLQLIKESEFCKRLGIPTSFISSDGSEITNSAFCKKQTKIINTFDDSKPTKEELQICAYIQDVILKNGGDSDFLGFVKNSGKYINVTYLYSIIKFKFSKNGKYFIVDTKVAKKLNLRVEDCSKAECAPFYLRVFFDNVADLKALDSYIFQLYKQNRKPALDYLKSHPVHKEEYLNGPEMYNKISDSELDSILKLD